jgi:hypothetical protein
MLWVGAVGFGVGVSGCFAAAVSQLQAYMGMTGRTGAWVAAGATSGTLVQLVMSQVCVCVWGCVISRMRGPLLQPQGDERRDIRAHFPKFARVPGSRACMTRRMTGRMPQR